ncbi:hypothetical protein, partial [Salmonella enterica]|uniref:hypothetical protein n=1 Tax=Salmonella enterica TaxID=28901 RepID=UPI001ADB5416
AQSLLNKNQLFRLWLNAINATNTALFSVQFCKRLPVHVAVDIGYLSSLDSAPRTHNLQKTPQLRLRFCGKGNSRNCAPRLRASGSGRKSTVRPARTRTSAAAAAAAAVGYDWYTCFAAPHFSIQFPLCKCKVFVDCISHSVNLSGRIDVVGLLPCACFFL